MRTITSTIIYELIVKNSRFISILVPINDNSNIASILDKIKDEYPKATHYCYGYITENYKKSSDDGEPGGTAGMPILNVLEKEGLINVLAVVVRYFGGIKLGAGGLVRAYTKSVKTAIDNGDLVSLTTGYQVEISFNYDLQKEVDYLLKDIDIISKEYGEKIIYNLLIPKDNINILNRYEYKIIKELLIKQ